MAEDTLTTVGIARHGAARLPSVDVDSFNIELKDDDGFLGDRASKGAFRKILDDLRKPLKKNGDDPLGGKSAEKISKSELDAALSGDDIGAAALVHGAIEEFANELAYVTSRFLKTKAWADTERIVVGGGFRQSRVGELAIARTDILLKAEGFKVDLWPIRFDSGRGRPDRLPASGAVVDFRRPRQHSRGRYRRHQYPLRRGRNPVEEDARPVEGDRSGTRSSGAMPTTSRRGKAPSSGWSKCSKA